MKTVQDYFNYITGIVDKCEIVVNRAALCRGEGKLLGSLMAPGRRKLHPGMPDGLLLRIEDIRFPTHSTNLEEILETIQRNFYR